jgi:SAM-dependent methyltransferase
MIQKSSPVSRNDINFLESAGLHRAIARHAPDIKGIVLDYGCGTKPYAALFANCVQYLSADIPGNPLAEIAYEIGSPLPLPDHSVDAILSTQVLQSVRDPEQYLGECKRVLRPGGRIILSSPGFWCYMGGVLGNRMAHDWRRWTHEGLVYELEKAGFKVLELDKICVRRPFLCQFMNLMVFSQLLHTRSTKPLGKFCVSLVNRIGSWYPEEVLRCSAYNEGNLAITYVASGISQD